MTNDARGRRSRISRRQLLAGAGTVGGGLAAAALVGCGDDDDDDAGNTPAARSEDGPTATAPGETSAQPTATESSEEFVIALEREPADMMPFFSGFDQAIALRAVNETMVHVNMTDDDGDGVAGVEYEGVLAASWERVEETEWVFALREGVQFHDETPFDADAAKFAFDLFADGELVQSAVLAGLAGTALGLVAGYRGGLADMVVMRIVDVQMAFPSLVLAIFLLYLLGSTVANLVILLVIFSWAVFARVARAQTLSLRNQPFVEGAVAVGAGDARIILRHITPHIIPVMAIIAVFDFAGVMLAEAGLSFPRTGRPPAGHLPGG